MKIAWAVKVWEMIWKKEENWIENIQVDTKTVPQLIKGLWRRAHEPIYVRQVYHDIVNHLNSQDNLSALVIWGQPGIGKQTLLFIKDMT